MNAKVKSIISAILILTLAAAGFFLGLQFTEKIPLADPIRIVRITLNTDGVSADKCVDMIKEGIVPDRLVENLMLLCTPDDLLQSMDIQKINGNTLQVEMPMEEEGNMIYFPDELQGILQEECHQISDAAQVTIADKETVTITYEEQPNMTMAYVLTAFGAVLGILFSLLIVLFEKKKQY